MDGKNFHEELVMLQGTHNMGEIEQRWKNVNKNLTPGQKIIMAKIVKLQLEITYRMYCEILLK